MDPHPAVIDIAGADRSVLARFRHTEDDLGRKGGQEPAVSPARLGVMSELEPFTVDVPGAALDDLRRRLEAVRTPDQPAGAGWEYGVTAEYLGELVRRWREEFDWHAVQDALNAWPQVLTTIGGQPVHAVHAPSPHPDAIPLLLLHGWPSTVADFLGILPALTERFHVVAPSLPGFGFSGPTLATGWDLDRHADTLLELMSRCGYERFVVQGGDWGGLIGPHVARRAPERVAMVHVNALVTPVDWTSGDPAAGLSEDERAQVSALGAMWKERQGYAAIQGRPSGRSRRTTRDPRRAGRPASRSARGPGPAPAAQRSARPGRIGSSERRGGRAPRGFGSCGRPGSRRPPSGPRRTAGRRTPAQPRRSAPTSPRCR
jgi:pimeloyl-ACP methyl ester carboxylesterase